MPLELGVNSQTISTAYPLNATAVDVKVAKGFHLINRVSVTTPAPQTFTVNTVNSQLTAANHGMLTGLVVQVSAVTTMPAPLVAATNYLVITIDANTFQLATTLANAKAGVFIVITTTGAGALTVTPTAIAGASFKLQGSPDNITFDDLGVTNPITATATFLYEKIDPMYNYFQCVYTLASGQISVTQVTTVKG